VKKMKKIAVVASGGGDIRDLTIEPGTTAADVLRSAGFEGFLLTKHGRNKPFAEDEVIYPLVEDGDKLDATLKAGVGSSIGEPSALFLPLGR
jgi:hypothetical protein